MKDELIISLDGASHLAVTALDCTSAAVELARDHLSGPSAASALAQALAAVSLVGGGEFSEEDETVTLRLDCPGAIEGFLVEMTRAGTLRGYTKKKLLGDFDGVRMPSDRELFGATGTLQIIRSIPGSILSSASVAAALPPKNALAAALDAYFSQSLQRRVRTAVAVGCTEEGTVLFARALAVECPPDGDADVYDSTAAFFDDGAAAKALAAGAAAPRTILAKLGLPHAKIRSAAPLSFACRCSAERAAAMLASLPEAERVALPDRVDITCHMCGRTWTVPSRC